MALLVSTVALASSAPPTTATNGGQFTSGQSWAVALVMRGSTPIEQRALCSGVLITANHVLTARHCFDSETVAPWTSLRVVIGRSDLSVGSSGQVRSIERPPYVNANADVALVTLDRPSTLRPIELAEPMIAPSWGAGTDVQLYGYGKVGGGTRDPRLQEVTFRINGPSSLNRDYDMTASWAGRSGCRGDSGGPVVLWRSGVPRLVGIWHAWGNSRTPHPCSLNDNTQYFTVVGHRGTTQSSPGWEWVLSATGWKRVSVGGVNSCGIRRSGRLFCWGGDRDGQLGDGGTNASQSAPTEVLGGGKKWIDVSVSNFGHACAVEAPGRLYCWGSNSHGQLGNSAARSSENSPIEVAGDVSDWISVDVGGFHTCALRRTGRLYCWGSDSGGEVGNGGRTGGLVPEPVEVVGGATDWTLVSAGVDDTCGLRSPGRAFCWGRDNDGQLGNGDRTGNQPAPTEVAGGSTDWVGVAAGSYTTCGRRSTGRVYCWGNDIQGALGDGGSNSSRFAPVEVAGGGTDWTLVDGGGTSCGRKATGRLFCWGGDAFGQVGDGGADADRSVPTEVTGSTTDWTSVSTDFHTCALKHIGWLYCWGLEAEGELGDGGSNTNRSSPMHIG